MAVGTSSLVDHMPASVLTADVYPRPRGSEGRWWAWVVIVVEFFSITRSWAS